LLSEFSEACLVTYDRHPRNAKSFTIKFSQLKALRTF
jgi:hypothetical protein